MRVAVVGLGYWGPKLLRNLVSAIGPDNVVAVDRSLDRLVAASRDFPSVQVAFELDEVLEDERVRAVVIATPVETHAHLARVALEAGRHVLVEKPLASSTAESLELVELAERQGLRLMVGHTFLFSPRVDQIRRSLTNGDVGNVHYVTSQRLNLGLHRSDANVIWDLAPHDFAILFHLLGEFPSTIQTSARSASRPHLPDVAFMNLEFPSGAIASVAVSWLAPRKVRNTVLVGENGMIVYDDINNDEPVKIYDKGVVVPDSADFGEHQLTYRYGSTVAPHVPSTEPLALQVAHFLDRIDDDEPCLSDGRFSVRVVEALEAAHQSWEAGGAQVELRSRCDLRVVHSEPREQAELSG